MSEVTVKVTYKDVSETFTGPADTVWVSVNRFFAKHLPDMVTLSKITLTVDVKELIDDLHDLVKIEHDGSLYLTVSKRGAIRDREAVMLLLIGAYTAQKIGRRERGSLSLDELSMMTGKPRKLVSTRLSELCAARLAEKDKERNFVATVFGLRQFIDEALPRIRRRLKV